MNVACPECASVFRVDPARILGGRVRARCNVCGGVIPVSEHVQWGNDFPDARLDPPRRREASPERTGPDPSPTPRATPAPAGGTRPPLFAPRRPTPVVTPTSAVPSEAVFPASSIRPPTPRFVPAIPATDFPAPPAPGPTRATPPSSGPVDVARATPASVPMTAVPRMEPPPVTAVPESTVTPAPGARRPINPFLSNDPNQKARRLARVLVSDMVTYHPQKRDEGLRAGTLKQVFRDEIRKSYEEYVEQVGRSFAEATSHFQDALNEILAGGKRLF